MDRGAELVDDLTEDCVVRAVTDTEVAVQRLGEPLEPLFGDRFVEPQPLALNGQDRG